MFRHLLKKNAIIPIILFFLFPLQIWGIDGTGMTFQIGVEKTLYKNLGIYLSEDIRPTRNFKEMGWFLFTAELNYKITPHLKVGAAYMNLARSGQADQLRNRYYIYVSGNYSFGELSISLRERFQGTYRAKKEGNPTNYLRSMLKVSYNAGIIPKEQRQAMRSYKIFCGSAHPEFGSEISKYLDIVLSSASITRFSDGEINVQIGESVRGKDVFIIQPTCAPTNDNLMELLIMTDALKRSAANTINAVVPYFGYARQDRKAAPRVPISAKLVANIIQNAGINRLITMDLHAGQIQGFFDIPVDNLYGSVIFRDYIKSKHFSDPIVASPDIGGVARARYFADKLGLDLVIVDKKREKANQSEVMNIIGEVGGKDVILIDDMIDTAGTMCKAADVLKQRGAKSVIALGTHPVLSGPAFDRIESSVLDEVVVTNSIPLARKSDKIKVLSVVPLFAEVIRRIHHNESVDSLFI